MQSVPDMPEISRRIAEHYRKNHVQGILVKEADRLIRACERWITRKEFWEINDVAE